MRLLTAAGGSGLMLGAAIGAAWLGGTLTRDAQVRAQAESLMSLNDHSYGADRLRQMNGERHLTAVQDDLDRRAIALVMRHDSYSSPVEVMRIRQDRQRSSLFAALVSPARARKAAAGDAPIVKAGLDLGLMSKTPFSSPAPAQPFALRNRSTSDIDCLTQAVYYEARGETDAGQRAVAQVILNRVRHPAYPKTICNVVYQGAMRGVGCQFSFTCNGVMSNRVENWAWKRARSVAEDALDGYVMKAVGSSTHFHVLNISPDWSGRMLRTATIGNHAFYQFLGRNAQALAAADQVRPSDPQATAQTAVEKVAIEAPAQPTPDARLNEALSHAGKDTAVKAVTLQTQVHATDAEALAQTVKPQATLKN
ncbi:MAG: cell wall hydrolase [Asticcacaulis sp.]